MKAFRLKFLLDVYTKKYWEILNVTFVSVQYEPCATWSWERGIWIVFEKRPV